MPPRVPNNELIRRAVHVLRNKVEGLGWHYFDVDLTQLDSKGGEAQSIFHRLERRGTEYGWPKGQPRPTAQQLFKALFALMNQNPKIAEEAFRRIFDLDAIPNQSGAFSGKLGEFNVKEQSKRAERFLELLRNRACRKRVVVLAEGDSWFQFPRISWGPLSKDVVHDVLDHLIDRGDLCLESIAAGGDWLSNMLHSRQYVDALSQLEPDVFLFSGGGNDLLGEGRAGNMVVHKRRAIGDLSDSKVRLKLWQLRYKNSRGRLNGNRFASGLKVLADEFFQFLNLVFVQYVLFLRNLRQSRRFEGMLIVTQGYDFVVPRRESTAPWWAMRRYVNNAVGSGKWLWIPFEKKELNDSQKKDATYAMVFEFNELLMSIARFDGFAPMAHIDCRGLAADDDWYDEIHLTSKAFKTVAKLYVLCMREWLSDHDRLRVVYSTAQSREADEAWDESLPPRQSSED